MHTQHMHILCPAQHINIYKYILAIVGRYTHQLFIAKHTRSRSRLAMHIASIEDAHHMSRSVEYFSQHARTFARMSLSRAVRLCDAFYAAAAAFYLHTIKYHLNAATAPRRRWRCVARKVQIIYIRDSRALSHLLRIYFQSVYIVNATHTSDISCHLAELNVWATWTHIA